MGHSADMACHLPTLRDEKASLDSETDLSALLESSSFNLGIDPRRIFANRAMPVAFASPWIAGMVISWIPFIKIHVSDAPNFLLLAASISTLEVLSIFVVFICTSFRKDTLIDIEASRFGPLKETIFRTWFWFLFISPLVTSTFVVLMASDISCNPDDDLDMNQPICIVGVRLIKATALCRAGIMCAPPRPLPLRRHSNTAHSAIFLFVTSSWLERQRRTRRWPDPESG
ncbi:hypothetical protein F66182_9111 [Fusarium sp. NRRL 66182]|nr:hypothetical protein F66182_9111 [Fusarium sp. NRRL 66182]